MILAEFASSANETAADDKPHIIFIMVDDLGLNDVSFRGSEIQTPNIDRLASQGVILDNYYTAPVCGPTRAQFLSGVSPKNHVTIFDLLIVYDILACMFKYLG